MYRLEIKNFQSIKEAQLEFRGFTVICGKSNLGKSALLRAVESVLFNEWQKCYQRTNTAKTEISFSKGADFKVSTTKSKNDNSFVVNDKSIDKIGKDAPELPLNFNRELNISTQLEPLFMVAYKDTENTKILNRMFNIDRLETAQSLCSTDLRKQKQDATRVKEALEAKQKEVEALRPQIEKLRQILETLKNIVKMRDLSKRYMQVLDSCENANVGYKNSQDLYSQVESAYTALKGIENSINHFEKCKAVINQGVSTRKQIEALPTIPNTDTLSKLLDISRYNSLITNIDSLESHKIGQIKFYKCKGIKKLFDYLYVTQRESSLGRVEDLDKQIQGIEEELSQMVCPTCKQPLG